MEQDLDQSLKASFWTRSFPINPLYILGVLFVIAVYVVLPVYLYTDKLKNVCCEPDDGTALACSPSEASDSMTDGTLAEGTPDVAPTLRKLLAPVVHAVTDQIGAQLVTSNLNSQQQPGGSSRGIGEDPWAPFVARG
jgi:hypothetical protein